MVGERYLFKGVFYLWKPILMGGYYIPKAIRTPSDMLTLYPLNDQGLWYVHVPEGEVDFTLPGLEHLPAEIEAVARNQREIQLKTTVDMTAIPIMQDQFDAYRLIDGRFLNHADYTEKRHVAVIHEQFATLRGLSAGDSITVSVPDNQGLISPIGFRINYGYWGTAMWYTERMEYQHDFLRLQRFKRNACKRDGIGNSRYLRNIF
jgi:hypothetical protein